MTWWALLRRHSLQGFIDTDLSIAGDLSLRAVYGLHQILQCSIMGVGVNDLDPIIHPAADAGQCREMKEPPMPQTTEDR